MNIWKPTEGEEVTIRLLPAPPGGELFYKTRVKYEDYPPIDRYHWKVIDKSDPAKGPMIWSVSKHVHQQLLERLVSKSIPVPLSWWKRLWNWLRRKPQPTVTVVDLDYGNDVTVLKTRKHDRFWFYELAWDDKSTPVGTPQEREKWLKEIPLTEL